MKPSNYHFSEESKINVYQIMSGDFSPESYLKSNSWKELHQSFEECKQQLQHEIDTREMLSKV